MEADRAHLWYRVDLKSLIRAALLHDYFLYDWHDWDNGEHQWHGFTHGHAALVNALKDFKLNDIERNSIENHMFPMTPVPPRYIEGYLVTLRTNAPPPPRPSRSTGSTSARCPPRSLTPRSKPVDDHHTRTLFPLVSVLQFRRLDVRVHSLSCQQHRLVNRGFLNGPLCPIYGTGAILGVAILGNVHNPIIIFLISMVGATILEYTTSWVMEQLFHARWWDYSNFRFNLQGRVCLLGALIFGLGGVGVVLGSQPYVERVTDMIPLPMLHTLVTVLALITIIDLAVTVAGMLEFERVLDSVSQVVQDVAARAGGTWQWGSSAVSDRMRELSQDTVERLRWAVNGVINAQQKRMLKSFPKFQVPDRQDIIDSLRELMGPRR